MFDAWLGFVQERQRKKGRIESAVGVYRATLLKEGVTRVLRYVAGMKQFRGQLQAQHQLKVKGLHVAIWLHAPGSDPLASEVGVVVRFKFCMDLAVFLLSIGSAQLEPFRLLLSISNLETELPPAL